MIHDEAKHSIKRKTAKSLGINLGITTAVCLIISLIKSGFADCDITELHAHKYSNDDYQRYIVSERYHTYSLDRSNEYILITEDEKKLLEFVNSNDLFLIEDNLSTIENIESSQIDFTEYRYSYDYMQAIPHITSDGESTSISYTYIPMTAYSWTNDETHSRLTGETRIIHHMYYAYKVEQNEKGKYTLTQSDLYDSIEEIPNDYKYIKKVFYKEVDSRNINEELTYEEIEDTIIDEDMTLTK